MVTSAFLNILVTPILFVLSFVPSFGVELSQQIASASVFLTRVVGFAWGWRNWIPLQLIAVCLTTVFTVWVATLSLSFFRVIYSMFFGGGGSK